MAPFTKKIPWRLTRQTIKRTIVNNIIRACLAKSGTYLGGCDSRVLRLPPKKSIVIHHHIKLINPINSVKDIDLAKRYNFME